jgi:hypothetical protein
LPRKRYAPYPACVVGLKVQIMQTASNSLQAIPEALAPKQSPVPFPPIEQVSRPNVPTEQAAYYLDRQQQTLRAWACLENGPLRPLRINGRLAWPVAQLRRVLGVAS